MSTTSTFHTYKDIPLTPEIEQAIAILYSEHPTTDALLVVLDRLHEQPGHNACWSFSSQDLTEYFESHSSYVELDPLCAVIATHWDRIGARYSDSLNPALSALLLYTYKARVDTLSYSPLMDRVIRTLRAYPRFSNPYFNEAMIRILPSETMTDLARTQDLMRFLPRDINLDTSLAIASRTELFPVLPLFLQTLNTECSSDTLLRFIGSFQDPQQWIAISHAIAQCPTSIHPFLLCNPLASGSDILRGLRALGTIKKRVLTMFPSCDFRSAPWHKLKPDILLKALAALYRLETPHSMLLHGPEPHIIEAARITIDLNPTDYNRSVIVPLFDSAQSQHHTMLSHGIDHRVWLPKQLTAILGDRPTALDLFEFAKRIMNWANEDLVARNTIAANLHEYLMVWHRYYDRALGPHELELTQQLLTIRPPFLFPL